MKSCLCVLIVLDSIATLFDVKEGKWYDIFDMLLEEVLMSAVATLSKWTFPETIMENLVLAIISFRRLSNLSQQKHNSNYNMCKRCLN